MDSFGKAFITIMIVFTFCLGLTSIFAHLSDPAQAMSMKEREELKEEARDMFYHAYRAYMENAYPADELMPLSCSGRYRGTEPSRGDIDDTMGNFSLTLVDSLDTLVVLGDLEEFEHAVKLVIRDVSFDNDVVVSVFETNIRVLGGLLSAHILADYLQQRADIMPWYRGELLNLARDLGYRLLPAFNTTTGIPHARINLRHGLNTPKLEMSRETCTACAGTMILEMAALSRLTGEPVFEEKAHKAMDELWKMRHRSSDLMGTVLNIHSGDWVRRDSGVGAGIDSYYEYCLKAYILLGDERYLGRFNKHYSAVMKYISQGPMLLDVHMHRPYTNSRNFMDALLAFWPGLQVLKGDLKPAVETHEMLYQVMQRHNFIPEAFTTDFQVHWGQHPLRPEFLESTYFLHRATGDPYYLEVGRSVLRSLQKYARVSCGYAAVKDVRTGIHEDRMDSFVLAETFKYLFLLFADPSDLILDLDEFLFTTEAHLLPLSLARSSNYSIITISDHIDVKTEDDLEFARSCPNTLHLFPESVRRPLRNMVDCICPRQANRRKLHAQEFQAGNPDHMKIVKDMGISILTLADGRVQLLHTFGNARSPADAEEGLLFMQEMVELSKSQTHQPDAPPQAVFFKVPVNNKLFKQFLFSAGPAHFGQELRGHMKITGKAVIAQPMKVCEELQNPEKIKGHIAIMERGDCMFVDKARRIQKAGAIGGIVIDNTPGTSALTSPMFAMSGDGTNDVKIPVVFLFHDDAVALIHSVNQNPLLEITLADMNALKPSNADKGKQKIESVDLKFPGKQSADATLEKLKDSVQEFMKNQDIMSVKNLVSSSEDQKNAPEVVSKMGKDALYNEIAKVDLEKISPPPTLTSNEMVSQIREMMLSHTLQSNPSNEGFLPAPVLKLFYQQMHKELMKIGGDKDASSRMQAAWLLTELARYMEAENMNIVSAVTRRPDSLIVRSQDSGKNEESDSAPQTSVENASVDSENTNNEISRSESAQVPSETDDIIVSTDSFAKKMDELANLSENNVKFSNDFTQRNHKNGEKKEVDSDNLKHSLIQELPRYIDETDLADDHRNIGDKRNSRISDDLFVRLNGVMSEESNHRKDVSPQSVNEGKNLVEEHENGAQTERTDIREFGSELASDRTFEPKKNKENNLKKDEL